MEKSNFQEVFLLAIAPLILFGVCLIISQLIMPENCYLYDGRNIGFLCDSLDLQNPQPCPICNDELTATIARILFGLSFGFLALPILVFMIREKRKRPIEQIKLFD